MARRVGILGGTFDPPHLGHVAVGVESCFRLDLDATHMMVANNPWQKSSSRRIAPATSRWVMTEAACAGHPLLVADDAELARGGETYTIDTVEPLVAAGVEVFLILGDDAAARLDTWHRCEELADLVTVGIVARPAVTPARLARHWRATRIECPLLDISSTEVRRRCAAGEPVDHLVGPGVLSVIEAEGLYGFGR
ncbi:MAG: nicotinate-nicotinamide nucleotide adenylyltransferase [Microthrixaceae bacterium]|nr:nicotinate-nicotinamide nucleotide adenylyltransferase [Microthrixaceae bacterium]